MNLNVKIILNVGNIAIVEAKKGVRNIIFHSVQFKIVIFFDLLILLRNLQKRENLPH